MSDRRATRALSADGRYEAVRALASRWWVRETHGWGRVVWACDDAGQAPEQVLAKLSDERETGRITEVG